MPPLPPVPSTMRIRLNGTYQGAPWNAIQHWKYNGSAPSEAQVASICAGFAQAYGSHMVAVTHSTVALVSVEGWDISDPAGNYGSSSPGTTVGTLIGNALPVSIAAVTTWKVQYRWKGGHPRTYWPAGDTSKVASGKSWDPAFINLLAGASDGYLAAVNAITASALSGRLVCVRRSYTDVDGAVKPFVPPLTLDIIDATVDSRLDSQRRRLGPDVPA